MGEIEEKAKVYSRRHTEKEERPETSFRVSGDFFIIGQGMEIVLLSQKEVFENLPKLQKFAKGEK